MRNKLFGALPSLEESNLLRQKVDVGSSSKRHNLEVLRFLLAYIQCLGPDGALKGTDREGVSAVNSGSSRRNCKVFLPECRYQRYQRNVFDFKAFGATARRGSTDDKRCTFGVSRAE